MLRHEQREEMEGEEWEIKCNENNGNGGCTFAGKEMDEIVRGNLISLLFMILVLKYKSAVATNRS